MSSASQDHGDWRPAVKPLECTDAATAVDFAPCCHNNKLASYIWSHPKLLFISFSYLLAVGLDNGTIFLCHFDWNKITVAVKFNQSYPLYNMFMYPNEIVVPQVVPHNHPCQCPDSSPLIKYCSLGKVHH